MPFILWQQRISNWNNLFSKNGNKSLIRKHSVTLKIGDCPTSMTISAPFLYVLTTSVIFSHDNFGRKYSKIKNLQIILHNLDKSQMI